MIRMFFCRTTLPNYDCHLCPMTPDVPNLQNKEKNACKNGLHRVPVLWQEAIPGTTYHTPGTYFHTLPEYSFSAIPNISILPESHYFHTTWPMKHGCADV